MSQNFKNAFPIFHRENLRIHAHEYVTKYNIAVRYYINELATNLFALMIQSGKGFPKWNLYNPSGKKICQIKKGEKIAINDVMQNLDFHDNLINWALEESIKDMDSRLFLAKMGYKSALIRSIDDPWTPLEYDANN